MTTFTPSTVASDMLDMLPSDIWNPESTFLDISCKTGAFLIEIYKRLDKALSVMPEYTDDKVRHNHIINKQIYGLSLDDCETLYFSRRNLTGDILSGNISYIGASNLSYADIIHHKDSKILKEQILKEFNRMDFNVVLGNPPYNRGGGHRLCIQSVRIIH